MASYNSIALIIPQEKNAVNDGNGSNSHEYHTLPVER